jgi:hydrogenase nickel incorporation protein HypA/HybF
MHEISLVQSLFAQLRELAAKNGATSINKVTMEIGPLSGVVVDSFRFGFEILSAEHTMFDKAELVIKIPEVEYRCVSCGSIRRTAETRPAHCSQCDERLLIPAGGDDLILLQVEME